MGPEHAQGAYFISSRSGNWLRLSKTVGGHWNDEFMTGDDQECDQNGDRHDRSTSRQAVSDARREAAAALSRLAEAAVRYADLRIAEETSDAPISGLAT